MEKHWNRLLNKTYPGLLDCEIYNINKKGYEYLYIFVLFFRYCSNKVLKTR